MTAPQRVTVAVIAGGRNYEATREGDAVTIYRDGIYAGEGTWTDTGITDCDADLGEETYQALDDALAALDVLCECGAWSGEACSWFGPRSETVRVRYVPGQWRGTAEAAGTWRGVAETIRVSPECADLMLEVDPRWTRRVGGRP